MQLEIINTAESKILRRRFNASIGSIITSKNKVEKYKGNEHLKKFWETILHVGLVFSILSNLTQIGSNIANILPESFQDLKDKTNIEKNIDNAEKAEPQIKTDESRKSGENIKSV